MHKYIICVARIILLIYYNMLICYNTLNKNKYKLVKLIKYYKTG